MLVRITLMLMIFAGTISAVSPADTSDTFPAAPVCYEIDENTRETIRDAVNIEPFEIMDGVYYVGNSQVSVHLVTTSEGLVLIDCAMPHQTQWLLDNIITLGFRPEDVKVVLGTHFAIDHVGGAWYLQHYFGSKIWLGNDDVAACENATCVDGELGIVGAANFPPFTADRFLNVSQVVETISYGGRTFHFYYMPVASPGAVAVVIDDLQDGNGKSLKAGIIGGIAPRGDASVYRPLIENLQKEDVQLFLAVHPTQNNTFDKAEHLGETPNPFIDPEGWHALLDKISGTTGVNIPVRNDALTDKITVRTDAMTQRISIQAEGLISDVAIYSSAGSCKSRKVVNANSTVLDVGAFPAGIYFMHIHQPDKSSVVNLIKNAGNLVAGTGSGT